ncbi:hypothetical protein M8J77_006992 [Diaphorina citri]|nr:hypothetical protein M8J77_006992 [Diaphorina citri]
MSNTLETVLTVWASETFCICLKPHWTRKTQRSNFRVRDHNTSSKYTKDKPEKMHKSPYNSTADGKDKPEKMHKSPYNSTADGFSYGAVGGTRRSSTDFKVRPRIPTWCHGIELFYNIKKLELLRVDTTLGKTN